MTSLKVSLSVLLFQLFIHDIPLGEEDMVFLGHCALFGSVKNHKALYKALEENLDAIQDWPRTKMVSFGIHKCWILLPTHRHSSRRSCYTVNAVPSGEFSTCSLSLHIKDLAHAVTQK
jgi:hypothetical protein